MRVASPRLRPADSFFPSLGTGTAAGTRKLVPVNRVRRGTFLFLDQRNRNRLENPSIAATPKRIAGGDRRASVFSGYFPGRTNAPEYDRCGASRGMPCFAGCPQPTCSGLTDLCSSLTHLIDQGNPFPWGNSSVFPGLPVARPAPWNRPPGPCRGRGRPAASVAV